jgi:predicted RNA-binding Zn ribbon-like protein
MTSIKVMLVSQRTSISFIMDDRDKRRIGEDIEPGGRPKAPGRLELLQRFLNTWNHELPSDWDRLGTPAKARAWLRARDLVSASTRVTASDAAHLRELREALRSLVIANHATSPSPTAVAALRRTSRSADLRVELDDSGRTRLEPTRGGVEAAGATMLGIVHEAHLLGTWPRLKGCRQCGYAFFDRSKNHSASWCAMSICGNRTKNRTYRRRRSSAPSSRRSK